MRRSLLAVAASAASVVLVTLSPLQVIASEKSEEIVVVGSTIPTESFKLGNSISVLDASAIDDIGVEYAADIFRHIPGLAISRSGGQGGLTQLRIRGAETNHVLVLVDGVEVAAAGAGEFDFASLLAADIERIEVLRGAQSGLYGSNATAGVISITTRGASKGGEFSLSAEKGSNNTEQLAVSMAGGDEVVSGRLNVTYRESEFDLSTDDSVIGSEEDKDNILAISASGEWNVNQHLSFDAHARYSENRTEGDGFDFSGGALQGLAFDDDSSSDDTGFSLGVDTSVSLLDGKSLTKFSASSTKNETEAYFGAPSGSESSRVGYAIQTTWIFDAGTYAKNQTTVFGQQEEETYRNTEPSSFEQEPEQERNLTGFGFEHRLELWDRMFLSSVLRRDNNDAFEDEVTYSTSIAYLIRRSGTRIHTSYGKGVTNPSFFEQFGFNPGRFKGNSDLKPEKSKGGDIGVEQSFMNHNLVFDLTYFNATLEDEIVGFYDVVDSLGTSVNSADESKRQGAEFMTSYNASSGLSLNGTYTYTHSVDDAGREARRPLHIASLSAAYRFFDDNAKVAINWVYNGSMLDDDFRDFYTNEFKAEKTKLASYQVVNINGSFQVNNNVQISARVNNLFDEDYEEVIGYQTPGVGYYTSVRLAFK
ncbi:MAG: TonB-dependent receptor [Pseudomonadales bacterium]|nr:TonB-dependent receptor [Pseudomonadales bacterium]